MADDATFSPERVQGEFVARRSMLRALVPGLAELRSGRPLTGAALLGTWLFLLTVALLRGDRVGAALAGEAPGRGAALALVLGLTATWGLALASARRSGRRTVVISTPWRTLAHRFATNRSAVAGLFVLGALSWVAILAPILASASPIDPGPLTDRLQPPSGAHLLGTDSIARDVLSRLMHGARVSLSVAVLAVALASTVGVLLGALAGYLGGWTDRLVTAVVDTVLSIPRIVLLIVLVGAVQGRPSLTLLVVVLGLTQWPLTARMIRGEVLSLRDRDFVRAAEALGFSRMRVLLRHVIPNALGPVIVAGALGVGNTIILEAGLSFLGLGVQPPTPSWGEMVATGQDFIYEAWWLSTCAGLAIVVTVVAANMVGDGLREGLNPRSEGRT